MRPYLQRRNWRSDPRWLHQINEPPSAATKESDAVSAVANSAVIVDSTALPAGGAAITTLNHTYTVASDGLIRDATTISTNSLTATKDCHLASEATTTPKESLDKRVSLFHNGTSSPASFAMCNWNKSDTFLALLDDTIHDVALIFQPRVRHSWDPSSALWASLSCQPSRLSGQSRRCPKAPTRV